MGGEEPLRASAGWSAPSDFVLPGVLSGIDLEIPEITVSRGGIDWGQTPDIERKPPVVVERDPRGHWEFAVDTADYEDGDTEPDIVSGWGSSWGEPERFVNYEQAAEYHPGGKVYKRWVPAPGPWDEA